MDNEKPRIERGEAAEEKPPEITGEERELDPLTEAAIERLEAVPPPSFGQRLGDHGRINTLGEGRDQQRAA